MVALIVFFFPAVLSVWVMELLRKAAFPKRAWLYRFCLSAMLINFVCFAVKKWILHTADAVIFSFAADMTPSVACNYLIMAIPLALGFALLSHFFRKFSFLKDCLINIGCGIKTRFLKCIKFLTWRKVLSFLLIVLFCLLVVLAFLGFYSAKWYANTYGQLGFDSILYTLLSDLGGVESDLVIAYLLEALVPALCWSIPICVVFFFPLTKIIAIPAGKRKIRIFPFKRWVSFLLSIVIFFSLIIPAALNVELFDYVKFLLDDSNIYQEEYVAPSDVNITFPEEKRNLIYIFLESMETTYFSKEQGGMADYCVIPELYSLAEENVNFSYNDSVGGLRSGPGSTWTIGAMVTQSAGIPLKTPPDVGGNEYGADGNFLPGITSITDILHENGYTQTLMIGSDPTFGGRQEYYTSHGLDQIYSIFTAWSEGFVPRNYYEWWGIEDRKLFEYARQKLPAIAAGEQPFALTLLTVDTHHVDGYLCPECVDVSDLQYENVLACSSRKVTEFIDWVKQQDFYENTTIVIVGDHPTMDNKYISAIGAEEYDRQVYNCFINSAAEPVNTKNRQTYTVDMFPTTLAAMGCTIEGDRLGLGTNLFSDTPTLAEEMGAEAFADEIGKRSSYYTKNFFFQ